MNNESQNIGYIETWGRGIEKLRNPETIRSLETIRNLET